MTKPGSRIKKKERKASPRVPMYTKPSPTGIICWKTGLKIDFQGNASAAKSWF